MKKKATTTKPRKAVTPRKKPTREPTRKVTRLVKLVDLAESLAVTERTVRSWIKRGCPSRKRKPKKGGGPARVFLDPAKVVDWMAANDIQIKLKSSRLDASPPPSGTPGPKVGTSDPDLPKSGIVGAVARLRSMERVSYMAFLQAVKANESSDRVRAKERVYIEAHQALRRTEKEVPKILEHRGEMIPLETVLQEQAKIDLAIKNQFLTLPRKLATTLAEVDDPGEIETILQGEIDDSLRHIASGRFLQDEAPSDI